MEMQPSVDLVLLEVMAAHFHQRYSLRRAGIASNHGIVRIGAVIWIFGFPPPHCDTPGYAL